MFHLFDCSGFCETCQTYIVKRSFNSCQKDRILTIIHDNWETKKLEIKDDTRTYNETLNICREAEVFLSGYMKI